MKIINAQYIIADVIGLSVGGYTSHVMRQVFNAVLPEAATTCEKVLQFSIALGIGATVGYNAQRKVTNLIDIVCVLKDACDGVSQNKSK